LLSLLFIVAVDRLKPTTANKSTNLRILGLVAAVALLATLAVEFWTTAAPIEQRAERGIVALVGQAILLSIYLVGAACEDPRLSRRIQWEYQWASGWRWPLRLILPGSASGLFYSVLVASVLLGCTAWLVIHSADSAPLPTGINPATRIVYPRPAIEWTAALLGSMLLFYAALGRWCSTFFAGAIYTRTVVIFVFVMANLVPVCLMTLTDQSVLGAGPAQTEHPSTLWNLHYSSAFLSLRSAWDMTGYWPLPDRGIFRSKLIVETWQINRPVAVVSTVIHLGLAAVLTVMGAWRQRMRIRPLLKVLHGTTSPRQP
jgi:hypothetical protein